VKITALKRWDNGLLDIQSDGPLLADTYFGAFWACSLGGILEQFGWFGGMLEEFVREKHRSG